MAGHTEAAGGHLLDGGTAPIAILIAIKAGWILAAFTGVGHALETVHRDSQGLMSLSGDGTVGHCAGGETLHDLADWFHLINGDGLAITLELEESAQRSQATRLIVHLAGVLLEDAVLPGAGSMLQLEDSLWVEQVVLAFTAPLVLATDQQVAVRGLFWARQECEAVTLSHIGGDLIQTHAGDWGECASEVLVQQVLVQTGDIHQLGTAVTAHRGNAHLGHDLQDGVASGVQEVLASLLSGDIAQATLLMERVDGHESHVGVDGVGTEGQQHGEVVNLAGIAGLDDQGGARACLFLHQVLVHSGGEQ